MSTAIKQEPSLAANKSEPSDLPPHIKHEGAGAASDDDDYEDAGDLDMSNGKRGLWLVKLPRFLLEQWDKLEEDEEITLGEILVSSEEKFRLKLNPSLAAHKDLPETYDMVLNNRSVSNTWVFTEKDMPGYHENGGGPMRKVAQQENMPAMPARLLYGTDKKQGFADRNKGSWKGGPGVAGGNRGNPYMRKAIPKKTALVGTVVHEATVMTPEGDEKYKRLIVEAHKKAMEPKKTVTVLEGPVGGNLLAPGTTGGSTGNFDTFIRKDKEKEKKTTDQKSTRMERAQLLDALFGCFKQYTAWSIKGLKQRLGQPEAYLKEVLGEIAVLHKSGRFALKYTLKPEYMQKVPQGVEGVEGVSADGTTAEGAIELDEDEDEEEEEMEDVL
ncbi:transcription initiation factor IIF, beta subunit-domain-containing protein [Terfezia claveryi]|nr:transcription initiation factor IIF, beta subunit-domain-containing protein [Terfezia claveryi]KAF8438249.1 transcription initiation factor IIF, beta subunit-domain-containing protein [Terfezia claveryi]